MFDVRHYDEIESTNDEARRLAEAGAPHGTVVHADRQSAGRGRLSRRWVSPPGNLFLSILLRYGLPPLRYAELSFLAAIAVAETADALLPKQRRARLKWPNDVLVDGGKLSGILLERDGDAVIVGIGLNVLTAPDAAGYPTASIATSGGIASVHDARALLLRRLEVWLTVWEADGFPPIRMAWLERAHPIGETLRVTIGARSEEGAFAGLDDDGALLLETPHGRRRFVAGDVGMLPA
jgi:BirA family biotin operon repressor/biotin-[acetyl-CoA-carboxylase] ligase